MIGILGGTFDPIHFGHLRPALELRDELGLREIRFIPLRRAVHRPQPRASGDQRLAMLKLAVAGVAGFRVDERELRRSGASYSFDTLLELRAELGAEEPLCLLLGTDAFAGFPSWHRPNDILGLAHLIVMRRPGDFPVGTGDMQAWVDSHLCRTAARLRELPAGRVFFQEVTALDISATAIRGEVARGRSPRFLVPDAVMSFIEEAGLYR